MNKVLIAEDSGVFRLLLRRTLGDSYEVLEAADGETALSLAREHKPALVVLDIVMKGMSGIEVCRKLKEDPHTKEGVVLMLTAKADEVHIEEARSAGADDYFTKPFSPKALLQKVEEVLGESQKPTLK
ncbi:MAG: response regulator [Actinobacteria bacterium]|nr:response regulator [Actinomycetota bacterium]